MATASTVTITDGIPVGPIGTYTVPTLQPVLDSLALPATLAAATSGGYAPYYLLSGASTNATVVKNTPGQVGGIQFFNLNAAACYVKFYDKASTPNPAADTIVKSILVPGATASVGAGTVTQNALGWTFATGISFATVTGIGNTNNTGVAASEVIVNIDWK
jgi:hypothetical protein